jgi:hypothetical protein
LYFTISTIWGLVERRFIPKPKPKSADTAVAVTESKQSESKKSSGKKGGKTRETQTPPKQEGRFTRWMREVMEKAAEQQKLGQQKQNRDKDKKKKKR